MTEEELDKIKKSFVSSTKDCPAEVACLLAVIKYYGGMEEVQTLVEWCKIDGKLSLIGMRDAAIRAGMEAEICLLNMELLSLRELPLILCMEDDFGVPGYVVCYGMHEGRFIVWESGFGPMQYWANEIKALWIKGVALTLFPTPEFTQRAHFYYKWWELYPWSKRWKRRLDSWYECIWLNVPWFRRLSR